MATNPAMVRSGSNLPAKNIEVCQLPSSTTNFLKPCDLHINKKVKEGVRRKFDELAQVCATNMSSVQTKLILGFTGVYNVNANDIFRNFRDVGLWPMDYRFLGRLEKTDPLSSSSRVAVDSVGQEGGVTPIRSSPRITDSRVMRKMHDILSDKKNYPSAAIKDLTKLLCVSDTVNGILMNKIRPPPPDKAKDGRRGPALLKGTPAQYLTLGEAMDQRKDEEDVKAAKEAVTVERRKARMRVGAVQRPSSGLARRAGKTRHMKNSASAATVEGCGTASHGGSCIGNKSRKQNMGIGVKKAAAEAATALVDFSRKMAH